MYKINNEVTDSSIFEHLHISRNYGRRKTDHAAAVKVLREPETLWSSGTTVVGLVNSKPITFELNTDPIWRSLYPHKPQAEEGIADIAGLKAAGVL